MAEGHRVEHLVRVEIVVVTYFLPGLQYPPENFNNLSGPLHIAQPIDVIVLRHNVLHNLRIYLHH